MLFFKSFLPLPGKGLPIKDILLSTDKADCPVPSSSSSWTAFPSTLEVPDVLFTFYWLQRKMVSICVLIKPPNYELLSRHKGFLRQPDVLYFKGCPCFEVLLLLFQSFRAPSHRGYLWWRAPLPPPTHAHPSPNSSEFQGLSLCNISLWRPCSKLEYNAKLWLQRRGICIPKHFTPAFKATLCNPRILQPDNLESRLFKNIFFINNIVNKHCYHWGLE